MTDEVDRSMHEADQALLEDSGALDALWFVDPASPRWQDDDSQMPDEVWERLARALRDEATERSAVNGAVPITATVASGRVRAGAGRPSHRTRRTPAWLVGSVAAGVALLGVGIVVQSVQSTREVPVVAAGGSLPSLPARGAQAVAEAAPLLASAPEPPARRVLASGTDYQPQTLRSQVVDLLARMGAGQASDFARMPTDGPMTVGTTGFTATLPGLRACITGLTQSEVAQALIVDRARYGGDDAGLVVVPEGFVSAGADEPIATAQTPSGAVDIWVVEPDCSQLDPGVILHLLHQVTGE